MQADQRPSWPEWMGQERFVQALRAASKFVVSTTAQRYLHLLPVYNHFDELLLVATVLVETHYLRRYSASFGEHFFGLKRVRSAQAFGLLWRDCVGSVLVLGGVPYVEAKLESWWERRGQVIAQHMSQQNTNPSHSRTPNSLLVYTSRWQQEAETLLASYYPALGSLASFTSFVYAFLFLAERSPYHSVWFHLLGLRLQRLSVQDYRLFRQRLVGAAFGHDASSLRRLKYFLVRLITSGLDFLRVLVPALLSLFQLADWWHGSDAYKTLYKEPPIPPPEVVPPHPRGTPVAKQPNTCSLCLRYRTNPAMLPTGYVFCYPCIHRYVEQHHRCPVTLDSAQLADIRKLYLQEEICSK